MGFRCILFICSIKYTEIEKKISKFVLFLKYFVNFVGEWWVVSQHRITACETIATNFLGFAWKGGIY